MSDFRCTDFRCMSDFRCKIGADTTPKLAPPAEAKPDGFRPDGELVAVETTHRRIVMCYR
jgi:hypothetical protein